MSVAARPLISATLAGDKIVLRSPKNEAVTEFYHSLPASRWVGSLMAWTCDATPAAAWRIANQAPGEVEMDDLVRELCLRFHLALAAATEGPLEQPAIRKTDGWRHQLEAYRFAYPHDAALLAICMGGGKSKVSCDLIVNRNCMVNLILCPVSVRGVWRREFEKHSPIQCNVKILEKGTVKQKTKQAEQWLYLCQVAKQPGVLVVNYESAWRGEFAEWALAQDWDCIVLDESHRAGNHNTEISKFASKLGRKARFRLCLTGTPMASGPLQLFGQFRFLDRGIWGTWFHHFKNRYARCNALFPSKVEQWLNQDEFKERFSLIAFRVNDSVLDLPPIIHHERRVELCEAAARIYEDLEEGLIAEIKSGVIVASNALVKLLRLQQITAGFAVADETEAITEFDDGKELALLELLDDIAHGDPVVVFCRFRHSLDVCRRVAEKLGRSYGELSGRRKDLTATAEMPEGIEVYGVQIQSGGVGVDLSKARYCAFFDQTWSLGEYDQAIARVHRPGQKKTSHFYTLLATGTVDEAIKGALENRREVVEEVLEALRR